MIHLILSASFWLAPQTAPTSAPTPADIETAQMIERHRAEGLCVTRMRPASETVEACTDRRLAAMRSQPGYTLSPAQARSARLRCERDGLADGETLIACMAREDDLVIDDIFGSDIGAPIDLDAPAAVPEPPPPPRPPSRACERETVRSADGTTTSSTTVCGDDADLARRVRDRLRPDR